MLFYILASLLGALDLQRSEFTKSAFLRSTIIVLIHLLFVLFSFIYYSCCFHLSIIRVLPPSVKLLSIFAEIVTDKSENLDLFARQMSDNTS